MGDEEQVPAQADQRLRVSVWAGTALINKRSVARAEQIIDDVSILNTVIHNVRAPGPDIGPLVQDGNSKLGDVIHACHSLEIQCLAGYDCSGNDGNPSLRGTTLQRWLRNLQTGSLASKATQAITDFAQDLVTNFVNKGFPITGGGTAFFDGISFDIETLVDEAASDNCILMYQEVHKQLMAATGTQSNKIVAVANGGMVDDTSATTKGTGAAMGSAKRHRYNMVNGQSNMIIRPMCYDNFGIALDVPAQATVDSTSPPRAHVNSVAQINRWHSDIIDYALTAPPTGGSAPNAPGVLTSQFQLGIKNFPGGSNVPRRITKSDGSFDHWETAGQMGGYLVDPADIRARCRILRKKRLGLVLFAFTSSSNPQEQDRFWKNVATYNWVLNKMNGEPPAAFDRDPTATGDPDYDPANPSAGTLLPALISSPRQVPHTQESSKRMEDS